MQGFRDLHHIPLSQTFRGAIEGGSKWRTEIRKAIWLDPEKPAYRTQLSTLLKSQRDSTAAREHIP
jgi:hypothetical protein